MPRRPSQTIRIVTSLDAASHFQRMKIDDGDVTIGRTCHERARPIRLHQSAGRSVPDRNSFNGLVSCAVDNSHVGTAQAGNQHKFSVGRKLHPVRAWHFRRQSLRHLLARNINNGNSSIAGICHPDFFAVRRNIKSFSTLADLEHHGFIPVRLRRVFFFWGGGGGGVRGPAEGPKGLKIRWFFQ